MRIKTEYHGDGVDFLEVYCTSEDTKPTEGVATGSIAVEVGTGTVYFYNEAGQGE